MTGWPSPTPTAARWAPSTASWRRAASPACEACTATTCSPPRTWPGRRPRRPARTSSPTSWCGASTARCGGGSGSTATRAARRLLPPLHARGVAGPAADARAATGRGGGGRAAGAAARGARGRRPRAGTPAREPGARMSVRAALLPAAGTPLRVVELELDPPQPGEVLVRLHASGVCSDDLNVMDGIVEVPCPLVPGHEGAGVVEAVGAEVGDLAPGDHVALSWAPYCGRCEECLRDLPH